jgi:hypothetical protein
MSLSELSPHLKEQFLREFTPSERFYFFKKAQDAVFIDGYVPGEDLYQYCYFLTQKKRLESMSDPRANGLSRYLAVEGRKDIEEAVKIYKDRLEKNKRIVSFEEREHFIRYIESFPQQ